MTATSILRETAHQIALAPLLFLAGLHVTGRHRGAAWWWLAGAFLVSWVADSAVDLGVDWWLVSVVYPVSQAAIVGAVLLDRSDAIRLALVLSVVGMVSVLWRGVSGPDVLLRTVAWGAVVGVAWQYRAIGRTRLALLVYFGVGLVAWYVYVFAPSWWTWGGYQAVRALGIGAFCWASLSVTPQLRAVR